VDAVRLENDGVLAEIHDAAHSITSRTSSDTNSSADAAEQAGTGAGTRAISLQRSDSLDSLVGRCRLTRLNPR
jgi:hypothetical protein